MIKNIYKVSQLLAFVPFMAIPSISLASHIGSLETTPVIAEVISVNDIRKQKAEAIDTYFKDRSMPLEGTGMTFVLVAEKYGLDWRLLPAIGIRESSGGKAACGKKTANGPPSFQTPYLLTNSPAAYISKIWATGSGASLPTKGTPG